MTTNQTIEEKAMLGVSEFYVNRHKRESENHKNILNAAERFWLKVNKSDGCWEWIGTKINSGYGQFYAAGKHFVAHRVSWIVTHGLPGFLNVCHKCDYRICVNPDHLFLGTQSDNMRDCGRKGRMNSAHLFGQDNPASKLSPEEIDEIRSHREMNGIAKPLSKKFGVTTITILRTWKKYNNQ